MKKTISLLVVCLLAITVLWRLDKTYAAYKQLAVVTVDSIPSSISEFISLRDRIGKTPQGGATLMIIALYIYGNNESLGLQCLTLAIDKKWIQKGKKGYKGYQPKNADIMRFKMRIKGKNAYKVRSYFQGATPANGYKLPNPPYKFQWGLNPYSDKKKKLFKLMIKSTGADNPRPLTVHPNSKGIYKAYEWSSMTLGVRKPASNESDDL
ncbi:MAG: hypothetical protein OEZ36_02470 [Spirochaetota bacterium]|nr:hypothetical protein [Spirochaetota bacterium]